MKINVLAVVVVLGGGPLACSSLGAYDDLFGPVPSHPSAAASSTGGAASATGSASSSSASVGGAGGSTSSSTGGEGGGATATGSSSTSGAGGAGGTSSSSGSSSSSGGTGGGPCVPVATTCQEAGALGLCGSLIDDQCGGVIGCSDACGGWQGCTDIHNGTCLCLGSAAEAYPAAGMACFGSGKKAAFCDGSPYGYKPGGCIKTNTVIMVDNGGSPPVPVKVYCCDQTL